MRVQTQMHTLKFSENMAVGVLRWHALYVCHRLTIAIYACSVTLYALVRAFGFPERILLTWGQRVAKYEINMLFSTSI